MSKFEHLRSIVGPDGWVAGETASAPYLSERRRRYESTAAAIICPANTREVAAVVSLCAESGISVVPQGGNTGLVGGAVAPPADGAVILNLKRMNAIRALDPESRSITVEAGCILTTVQEAAANAELLFPLSLAAEGSCQIGGNLATNAGGVHVLRYGSARSLTLGLEVVLPDGRIWDGLRTVLKDNTGYDLKQLFVGSEGTLGVITAAALRLFSRPTETVVAVSAVDSIPNALAAMSALSDVTGMSMAACELMSAFSVQLCLRHIPGLRPPFRDKSPWIVLFEFHGSIGLRSTVQAEMVNLLEKGVAIDAVLAENTSQTANFWRLRESVPEAQSHEGASIKHDISVPPERMGTFVEQATQATQAEIPGGRVVAFGHLGDGNLHFNISQPLGADPTQFLENWDHANQIVHDIAVSLGGSISAEHGIGLAKLNELARLYSPIELELMHSLKEALDPEGIMNPGKILPQPCVSPKMET